MDFTPIDSDPHRLVSKDLNLDTPIRRIFRLDRMIEAIGTRTLALVLPSTWEDCQEDPAHMLLLSPPQGSGRPQMSLSAYLVPAWAQCWSLNPGSDTLLRAYSSVRRNSDTQRNDDSRHEGVSARTTIRKLFEAAKAWMPDGNCHAVIGKVEYHHRDIIAQKLAKHCDGQLGPRYFQTIVGRASSLLLKREYYRHEEEVRIMLISRGILADDQVQKVIMAPFDPNRLFDAISFDPRLHDEEKKARTEMFRKAGFGGIIADDEIADTVISDVQMSRDWEPPLPLDVNVRAPFLAAGPS